MDIYKRGSGVMIIIIEDGHGGSSSNPRQDFCISHSADIVKKGIDLIITPPAMRK